MKFDIFYQLPKDDSQDATARYQELMAEAELADRLGFDTIWLAEVHFAPRFSLLPTPLLLLAAIAARTTRLRLGLAVNLVPLHQPIRLAEEMATLDVLSGGRAVFGVGRGAFPLNYRGYGVAMVESRARFEEGIEFVREALDQQRFSFEGQHFRADRIELVPRPLQQPFPLRVAANSPETFTYAGRHAYPIFAGGPVNPFPVLADRLEVYERALKDSGLARPEDWFAGLMLTFVGRDRAAVRATIEHSLRHYFNSVAELIEPETLSLFHQAEFQRLRDRLLNIQYETVEDIMAAYGDAAFCADRIAVMRERFKFTRLVCWFETGGLSGHQNVLDSMRQFADKVMPRFS
ncbi:MAG TPA: LLM class flavin-dependent oxidoreductase [Candidatus Binataceae bacterium]|nr:LLM class flavin-dependent oxidoreductase [Candidatus Binataceae bacterium]